MKIKLLRSIVFQGAVWLKDTSPPVNAEEAKRLVEAREAEYVKAPAPDAEEKPAKSKPESDNPAAAPLRGK
jgi:hypothetical protein